MVGLFDKMKSQTLTVFPKIVGITKFTSVTSFLRGFAVLLRKIRKEISVRSKRFYPILSFHNNWDLINTHQKRIRFLLTNSSRRNAVEKELETSSLILNLKSQLSSLRGPSPTNRLIETREPKHVLEMISRDPIKNASLYRKRSQRKMSVII